MTLRKCPSCKEIVGAENDVCPRCGVLFRMATLRRFLTWFLSSALVLYCAGHFVLKLV